MSDMNAYKRVMCVFDGKKPDHPPVVPMIREWCSKQAGFDLTDEMESVEKHVYAQSYSVLTFGYDCVWDMFACHSESEAMGSVLKISKGHAPSVAEPAVQDYEKDLPKLTLFDPYQNRRLGTILEGMRRLKKRFAGEIPVIGYIQAPFRHVSMLRGSESAMKDLYKNPEQLKELCEIALSSLIVYAVAIINTGVDILFISDPSSSGDAISKEHWNQWGKPLTTRLVKLVKPTGIRTIMHICGNNSDRLESMAETGVDGLSLDEGVDFERARRILGPKYILMGNVSTSLLALGSPEEVSEKTKEVIEKSGKDGALFVSGGCIIPDMCPPDNIRAMVETAKSYGA
jgi:MtaA/CmuA family methyltransferase